MTTVGVRYLAATLCFVLLLAGTATGAGAVGGESVGSATDVTGTGDPLESNETGFAATDSVTGETSQNAATDITATQELGLTPDEPGSIAVTLRYEIPEQVTSLQTVLPDDAEVTGTDGFSRASSTEYEWDGEASQATVRYDVDVNETEELRGPEGASGTHLFVDAGEWALFRRPAVQTSWGWSGAPVGVTRTVTTAGPAYTGERIVYMGEHDVHERRAHGQRFELVVPERATLEESPEAILDSLATASDQLRVGDRDERLSVVAAPTTTVEWAVRGVQFDDADGWVRDLEPLDTAENTWLHEYVHARQDYETTADAKWTTEAMATYYAALLALEQDLTDFAAFRDVLQRGTGEPQARSVLAEPGSWQNAGNYWKGSLVAGDLDRRIRLATDGERSLQTVFSRLNAREGTVDESTLLGAVEQIAGPSARRAAADYTTTDGGPGPWSKSAHDAAFGSTPARVSIQIADADDALAVSGPYRNETLADGRSNEETAADTPLRLYTGETLAMTGAVTNAGDVATEYEAKFTVDERVVSSASGSIRPGETAEHTFERRFEAPGEHVLAIGSDEVTVEVFEPTTASVTDLAVNRTRVQRGGAVEFTATVTNDHDVPGRANLSFGGDDPLFDRRVALGPGAERTVTSIRRFDQAGEYTFSIGDLEPVVVTVERDSNGGAGLGDGDGSDGVGPGFGAGVAVVAAVLCGFALARRR